MNDNEKSRQKLIYSLSIDHGKKENTLCQTLEKKKYSFITFSIFFLFSILVDIAFNMINLNIF